MKTKAGPFESKQQLKEYDHKENILRQRRFNKSCGKVKDDGNNRKLCMYANDSCWDCPDKDKCGK